MPGSSIFIFKGGASREIYRQKRNCNVCFCDCGNFSGQDDWPESTVDRPIYRENLRRRNHGKKEKMHQKTTGSPGQRQGEAKKKKKKIGG